MATFNLGNISATTVVVGNNNTVNQPRNLMQDSKTLLLKILKPDPVGIKPTKNDLVRNLTQNYGFDLKSAKDIVASCLREGLIEMDSVAYRIGITQDGYDWLEQGKNTVTMDNPAMLNEFYSIANVNVNAIDNYQLANLGLEKVFASGIYPRSKGGGHWETRVKVKGEDYDHAFAFKITKIDPPYELDKFIDYHLNYYIQKGGEREKFLKHMRYVILPYMHRWYHKQPAHIELTQKWIDSADNTKSVLKSETKKPVFASHFERMINLGVTPFDLRNPVYKYRTVASAIDILKSNKVYFPTSNQLNDKLELHPSILDLSFSKETKEKYLAGFAKRNNAEVLRMTDEQFHSMMQTSIEFFKNNVGIYSTGKSPTNSSLWEHYGNNHRGVCLGFVIPQNAVSSHLSFNVHYTDSPKKIKLIDDSEGDITYDIFYWFCIKHQSFSFEEEVRLIDQNGYGLKPFDKEMLSEIIMGRDTTEKDLDLISKVIVENGYPIKRINKIVIKPDTFGLSIETVKQFSQK